MEEYILSFRIFFLKETDLLKQRDGVMSVESSLPAEDYKNELRAMRDI